ncbi:class I SAM-dependent methyltransferase [Isoptericola halotolerans]|uniref:SAM-dependent methyltransferase n=1 Tax=Isoptericola halotolerans TaxID=300560 RepID=A0ABX2A9U9_9MICO|nr:class I SAM-dependent methyltransferase [Isoptericola halotolerans]NOV98611.1 SAM-dependent methyltransferase [Isoptericola halotolerans]
MGIDAPLADRVFETGVAMMEGLSIYLGDRLGWYRELAAVGRLTPAELAERTHTQERYAREWCEQQAAAGFLTVDDGGVSGGGGAGPRFGLDAEGVAVFTDVRSTDLLAPFVRLVAASAVQLPALVEAYRHGGGVSWDQLGDDAREGQADMNRPWFEQVLPGELAGVPHLHEALGRPGAAVADVGCGYGWSTVALARAYPQARVVGIDVDGPSVERARTIAAERGVENVELVHSAGEDVEGGPYDVVFLFECLHDMPRPVEVLTAVRRSLSDGGFVVVMDEAADDALTTPADLVQRALYGFSTLCCLPDSLSHPGSAGTGTVMRRPVLERYAHEAGFKDVTDLPIEDFGFWRFSELR